MSMRLILIAAAAGLSVPCQFIGSVTMEGMALFGRPDMPHDQAEGAVGRNDRDHDGRGEPPQRRFGHLSPNQG